MTDKRLILGIDRIEEFRSAFLRICFAHGVAVREERPVWSNLLFSLRTGRMRTPYRLDRVEIREVAVAISVAEIEQSIIGPGDLARIRFSDAFTEMGWM